MDITTWIGVISGIVFIVVGINIGGSLLDFYDFPSIMITLGGTLAATLVNFPLSQLRNLGRVLKKVLINKKEDVSEGINQILELAIMARREGILSLESYFDQIDNPFVRKGIMLIVDGTNPELVKSMMETELYYLEERHEQNRRIFESMASYAPAFGMVGTLIGLINMLKNLDRPETLGPGMAVALITTFYGVILANMVFLPIAGKLKEKTQNEILYKEVMLEGILSIQAGENPRIIENKLNAFIKDKKEGRISSLNQTREAEEINAQ